MTELPKPQVPDYLAGHDQMHFIFQSTLRFLSSVRGSASLLPGSA